MKELLMMEPVFKEAIWGGSRLKEVYGYDIPSGHTGECWAISAHRSGDCRVSSGTYAGHTLSSLWREHKELFGTVADSCGEFPLLVKIIDARDDLSIQVHPDNAYAAEHENGSLGKMECWYILDCDEDGTIVIGHHAKDKEELRSMIEQGRWTEFIREVPIKKGDFFQINPGCVHAIKGGTLILEPQQSSDITYRVYDYDRLSEGRPRQLHVQQSIDVIEAPFVQREDEQPVLVKETDNGKKYHLITCCYYTADKVDMAGEWEEDFGDRFANVSILEGEGTVDGTAVKKGCHFIVPAGYGTVRFQGNLSFITSQAM